MFLSSRGSPASDLSSYNPALVVGIISLKLNTTVVATSESSKHDSKDSNCFQVIYLPSRTRLKDIY